jgi:hypothetical protein
LGVDDQAEFVRSERCFEFLRVVSIDAAGVEILDEDLRCDNCEVDAVLAEDFGLFVVVVDVGVSVGGVEFVTAGGAVGVVADAAVPFRDPIISTGIHCRFS